MKLYDRQNKRLLVFNRKAGSEFWDEHWEANDFVSFVKEQKRNPMVKRFTARFLKQGDRVLEGGCGIGQNVYTLRTLGYDVYGVDFAEKTINRAKIAFPELKLSIDDVRHLDFPNSFFDGYWSLGVIEHFFDGFGGILKEANRIIKPQGFLFLTFPFMSPLRKFKAKLGLYKAFESEPTNNFYEFILDAGKVEEQLRKYGFILKRKYPFDAIKGLKDEISFLRFVLQKLYDSRNVIAKGTRFLTSALLSRIAGHSVLLVFQKIS